MTVVTRLDPVPGSRGEDRTALPCPSVLEGEPSFPSRTGALQKQLRQDRITHSVTLPSVRWGLYTKKAKPAATLQHVETWIQFSK